jgi:hypothetical protein
VERKGCWNDEPTSITLVGRRDNGPAGTRHLAWLEIQFYIHLEARSTTALDPVSLFGELSEGIYVDSCAILV